MAVVPLRRPPIDFVDAPDESPAVTVKVGADGLIEIEVGTGDDAEERQDDTSFDANLAEKLDENALMALAAWLIEGIEADIDGRREWLETADRAADYLGIVLNDASRVSTDGTVCQAISTVMLETAMKLWATARAELLPVDGPVKTERLALPKPAAPPAGIAGADESQPGQEPITGQDEAGDDLADALEKDMNWYLTKGDRGYYPDTSKMLWHRCLIGNAFKEVYRCPIARKPLSRWVMAQDLIVSGDPSHLSDANRVTKRAKVRQSTMRRLQASGYYLDVPLAHPTGIVSSTELTIGETQGVTPQPSLPRDFDHTVFESCCELGSGTAHDLYGPLEMLDRDETGKKPGYPLPYHVSLDYDSRTVLAIRRNWKEGDRDHRARRRFVKYGFVPGFGFYDLGLIHLVGNPTQAATMIQRSVVDAGLFSNFPAWAMSQSAATRLENTVLRPGPGEVVKIPGTGATKLSDSLMPWPYKEPSASSMTMGQKLEGDVRKLGGVIEIPVGEGRIGNTPVGTIMSYIEAVSQVPGAVHKDDHISQAEEFEMLRELIAEEPEVLTRGNRSPARQWQVAEELLQPDLSPGADPNTPSQIHRLTKIQGLVMLGSQQQFAMGDADGPIVNQRAIFKRAAEVLSGGDADEYMHPPQPPNAGAQPPPDPRVVAAQIKAQSETQKTQGQLQVKQLDHQGRMAEMAVEAQQHDADRQSAEQRAAMTLAAAQAKAGQDAQGAHADRAHEAVQNAADRAHEARQNDADRALDHATGQRDRAHEAGIAMAGHAAAGIAGAADRQHQAAQSDADRALQADQAAADRDAAGRQHKDKVGLEKQKLSADLSAPEGGE